MRRRPASAAAPVSSAAALLVLTIAAAAMLSILPASAAPVRLIASDPAGVTLELTVGDWRLEPMNGNPAYAVRALLVAPGLGSHGLPGRPAIPGAGTLIALPPGARATAR